MAPAAVLFDLGGVVFDSPLSLIRDYETRHGLPEHIVARVAGSYAGEDGLWHQLERGELPLADFCDRFDRDAEALGCSLRMEALMRELAERALVRPAMIGAIRRLREAGFRLGALTNNWVVGGDHDEVLRPIREEFHAFVESCKVGMRKPEPRIYGLALDRLGVRAEDTVFLDDMGPNLKAARALGMHTIKVDDPDRALRELEGVVGLAFG